MKGKKAIVAALAVAAASCFLGIGAMGVGAEELPVTESYFGFETGASVRKEEPAGLRFIVNYGEEINALVTDEETALNVYIAPAEYFEKAAGDLDAVAARAVKAKIDKQTIYTKDDALYAANAVLGNVRYENINREFQAVAAIEKAGAETVYSEVSDARSIAYVASAAKAKGETEAVLDTFVQKGIAAASGVAEDEFVDGSYEIELTLDESLVLEEGGEAALTLGITPAVDLYAEWASDNEEVAVVDENGKVTAVSEGTANITAEVYGKTVTCAVTVRKFKNFGSFDFSEYETGTTEINGITVDFGQAAQDTSVSIVEDEGRKALKVEATTTATNNLMSVKFECPVIGEFDMFSAIDAELKFVKYDLDGKPASNGGNAGIGGEWNYAEGVSNAFTFSNGAWKTFTFSSENTFAAIESSGAVELFVKPWAEQKVEIYIASFTGRYGSLLADGNAVDLTKEFSLAEDEFTATFTPTDGEETAVADVASFTPNGAGTLTVFVEKQGYYPAKIEISVIVKPLYGTYLFDDMSLYTSALAGSVAMESVQIDGYAALKGTFTGTYPHFVIASPSLKSLADFDYFTVRYKLDFSTSGGVIGLKGTTGNVYNYPEHNDGAAPTDGEWKIATWRKDKIANGANSNPTGQWVWDYIAANGVLDFSVYAFAGPSVDPNVQTTFVIAEITGGFDDIVSEGTAIDLAEKFGSGLTQAVYTPADGEAQTLTGESLKTFIGAESGTLKLTFEVDGYRATEFTVNYTVA